MLFLLLLAPAFVLLRPIQYYQGRGLSAESASILWCAPACRLLDRLAWPSFAILRMFGAQSCSILQSHMLHA